MKDNTEVEKKPEILAEIWEILGGMRAGYKQERTYRRAIAMVLGEIFNLGRHTVTQMLRSLGVVAEDWSAWYRVFSEGRFDAERASAIADRLLGFCVLLNLAESPTLPQLQWWPARVLAPYTLPLHQEKVASSRPRQPVAHGPPNGVGNACPTGS